MYDQWALTPKGRRYQAFNFKRCTKLFTQLEEITMQRPKMIEQTVYKWIEGKYERITGPNQIPASEIIKRDQDMAKRVVEPRPPFVTVAQLKAAWKRRD